LPSETQILSMPVRLRRFGREITMVIDGTDPFATTKPDARLVKLLIKAGRFNAALLDSDGVPFAAVAKREGVTPSYFTRIVRLSYLAPDINPSNPRWAPAARSDRRQASGPLTSTARLARSANRARLCVSLISIHKPPPHWHCDKPLVQRRLPLAWHKQLPALGIT